MSGFHQAPLFRHSTGVTLSDTVENAKGSVGIHNASAAGGFVAVNYAHGRVATRELFLTAGEKLIVPLHRVRSTVTGSPALAEAVIELLF